MESKEIIKNNSLFCYVCGTKTNDIGMGLHDCPNCKETYQLYTDSKGAECMIKTSTVEKSINVSEN